MTTITHPVARFAAVRHRRATTVILVALFWVAGAVLAATARTELDARAPVAGAVLALAGIAAAAWAYTRLCAWSAGFAHALDAGIAWLLLAIVTEVVVTRHLGHGWYALLGTPERPLLRNVFLFVWIFAPAAFARRQENV